MSQMTQQEVCKALLDCGMGEMTNPTAELRKFEAYGDGVLNVAHALPHGELWLIDHEGEHLWTGFPDDDEMIIQLLDDYRHYASN